MGVISRAAFEVDDYWRIVGLVHDRLMNFDEDSWRDSYKTLLLLEYLLTHGPLRIAEEFERQRHLIRKMGSFFQFVDEEGFNWGLKLRNLSKRVINLIEDYNLLMHERTRLRRLTRGIKGFGSFSNDQQSPSSSSSSSSDSDNGSHNHHSTNTIAPHSTGDSFSI
ncbi:ENT3, partial [Linum perenne]